MVVAFLESYGSVLVTIAVLLAVEAASRSGNADSSGPATVDDMNPE